MSSVFTEVKRKLKSIPIVRNTFYALLNLSPYRLIFKANLKKVEEFDKVHGTDFGGRLYWDEIGTSKERCNDYSPSPSALIRTLQTYEIQKTDKICDLGCGKGFAMYLMSKYPFAKIGGVELSKKLCKIAIKNLELVMDQGVNYDVYNSDAGCWDGYDEYNIFYIYNSFPKIVMQEVEKRLEESYISRPRKIEVWYLCPEYPDVFMGKTKFWQLKKRNSKLKPRCGMHIFITKDNERS